MGFYLANENNLAVYEDGIFRPYINNESIDRLVRKTEAFSFQMHAFEGQQSIISQRLVHIRKSIVSTFNLSDHVEKGEKTIRELLDSTEGTGG